MDWVYKIDWLYWIDFLLFGAAGFGITIWTLINTSKVKTEVSKAFEKVKFSEELKGNIETLEKYMSLSPIKEIDVNVLCNIKIFLQKISTRYKSFLSSDVTALISETIQALQSVIVSNYQDNEKRTIIIGNLTMISEELQKEIYANA